MNRFCFIIPPKNFRDVELLEPKRILEAASVEVEIASKTIGEITGADGASVQATRLAMDLNPADYAGVAFVGGPGMAECLQDADFIITAKKFFEEEKITAAICVAPAILANAGILSTKTATAWPGVKGDLIRGGAVWSDDSVVVDGQTVTANGPGSATKFGKKLLNLLDNSIK